MDYPHGAARASASEAHSRWTFSSLNKSITENDALDVAGTRSKTQTLGLAKDQVVSSEHIEAENAQDTNSPINQLPVELLLQVFHYDDRGFNQRLVLTHVCHRWRTIVLASGPLWTSIKINPPANPIHEQIQNFFFLLDLQLERSQMSPLDVFWHIGGPMESMTDIIVDHLRHKGHFSRWKSLTLSITSISGVDILPGDSFHNLESLVVLSALPHVILTTINATTTSQLRTLDLSQSGASYGMIDILYGAMLKCVSQLVLPAAPEYSVVDPLPDLPANIVNVESRLQVYHTCHPFPYVKTYKLVWGGFREGSTFDLRSLVTLIITSSLIVMTDCRVVLPSLRRFVCGNIILGAGAVLEAPSLDDLEFREDANLAPGPTSGHFGYIEAVLDHPGFLLSPTKSLLVEPPLPSDVLLKMITQYSRLEKLDLKFNRDTIIWRVTDAIGGNLGTTATICPRLGELRLRFARGYRRAQGPDWWKKRAARILQGREGCAALTIYGAWLGGENFTLLT